MTRISSQSPTTGFYRRGNSDPQILDTDGLRAELARLQPLAELGRMAATVAHEVRNPLAGISANAELLREALHDPDDLEAVDIILGEVERLGRLVSDLLFYSRERPPTKGPLDLAQLARTVRELSARGADGRGIAIHVDGSGFACGDAELSRQALLNLVRNALQACASGSRVNLQVHDAEITIADEGCGIPDELLPTLFQPFVTGRTRGLGLGLAVARRCLRRQGGDLVLVDTGPSGTRLRCTWAS